MKMRSSQRLGVVVLTTAALALAACGGDDTPDDAATDAAGTTGATDSTDSTETAASGGTLEVGVKFDQPLFGVETPDGVIGFDAEIARHIASEMGMEVNFREAVSANREPFLQNGEVDMVAATYTINEERDEIVDFAGPYYVAGQDIMVPADNPLGIEGIEDLNNPDVRTCTVEGSTSLANLNEMAPDATVSTFDTYSKCADAMGQGRADAVTTDNVILLGLAEESGGDYVLVENPFTEEPYGIGVAEGSEMRCQINEILQAAYDDGTWTEIYESTVGQVASVTPEPPEINTEGC